MRNWKQRLWSLLLCGAMLASLCPTARAEDVSISYLDQNGDEKSCETYTAVTADSVGWNTTNSPSGWYVVESSVKIEYSVNVTGEVHLILANGCDLKVIGGIKVSKGSSLTIYAQSDSEAMGKLTATGSSNAGIGGGGNITINGGTVTATSDGGAGIGGGYMSDNGGNITINGGTVNATSQNGAGIGGGRDGAGGKITISGGEVKATSKGFGAGIGGGGDGGGGGSITISGGTVEASSTSSADIGGGYDHKTSGIAPSDKIEISEDANVKGSGGDKPNLGPPHGAKTEWASDSTDHWHPCEVESCAEQFDKAAHSYGNEWKSDAASHWHECSCGDKSAEAAHSFGEWVTDQDATSTTAGSRHRDCGECQYQENQTIPPVHSHSYGNEWRSDAASHWHECSCGDQSDYAAHTPGDWIVDQAAPATTAGSRHKECTVCGYTMQTETIPATGGGSSGGSSGGGYTPPTYKPDVTQPGEGGTVSVTPSRPERGDTVTVNPKPDEGYELDSITVTDKNGNPVEVTVRPDGTYTFIQPAGKVKIEVSYKAVQPVEAPWSNPFTDLSEGDWYYEAVRFVQERGLMNGIGSGNFAPNAQLSRAQLAQILFNKEGRPGVNYLLTFPDVAGEAWYTEAIRWTASQGIVGGYGDGTFGPDDPITREQLAVMLWRYSGSPAATSRELYFNDTDEISGFALEALRWAVENGILNGYGDGRLGPQGQATRAQVAQMLKNFIENQEANT